VSWKRQYVEVAEIVAELHGALKRGVEVVLLAPAIPEFSPTAHETVERRAVFEARATLGKYDNFTLAGIAGLGSDGLRKAVYVHSKLMLIDDAWATVGSCNLHRFSLFGSGELNAAFSDPEIVRAFRVALFQEHLAQDTSALDDRAAFQLFHRIARENRQRHENSDPAWQGLAISLDPTTYGRAVQF
jgi:cardiolipin synthase